MSAALMSAPVLVHASLGEDALRPRTMLVLSSVIGGVGTLLALARGYFLMFEPVTWRVRAVSIAVGAAALVIVLAALIPRWMRLAEMGV